MKLLSIDVGIKNLAYCVLDIDSGKYTIAAWDVINLCGEPLMCNQKTKTGNCSRKAKYHKGIIHCCKICAKKTGYIIPSTSLLKAYQGKTKIQELKIIAQEHNIDIPQKSKKKEIQNCITSFIEQSALDSVKKINSSDMSLVEIGISIRNAFDNSIFQSLDTIIIENQISPIANRMKTIQGMIAQFFIMKGMEDVHFVSASNKLKPYVKGKTTYKERKAIGILTTQKLIHDNEDISLWNKHFSKHSKKDDLADSFLQGLWYMNKNMII